MQVRSPIPAGWLVAGAVALGYAAVRAVRALQRVTPDDIHDCSAEFAAFYREHVRLSLPDQERLREHREANRTRIKKGLAAAGRPRPIEFFPQGSYAMDTINQERDGEYDIDDAVVFDAAHLIGPRGASLSALQARQLVFDCIERDQRLHYDPEPRPNCVRIPYAGGYHVDVAVYRQVRSTNETYLEHAGPSWHRADPRGVTNWFQSAVNTKSPDKDEGQQLRRVVRLIKRLATSRSGPAMPSGFVLSVLAVECYEAAPGRDDAALYLCLRGIQARIKDDLVVKHPVVAETLTRGDRDPRMLNLRRRLDEGMPSLSVILERGRSHHEAVAAWSKFFNAPELAEVIGDA